MNLVWSKPTDAERATYRRWWLERSGLTRDELVDIARALGGDVAFESRPAGSSSGRRLFGGGLRGLLVAEESDVGDGRAL